MVDSVHKKPSVIVAQLGARMHYAVPRNLHEAGMLAHLYTDICATRDWPRLLRFTPPALRSKPLRRLLGRVPEGIPGEKLTAFTDLGWRYVRELGAAHDAATRTRVCLRYGTEFCERIIAAGFGKATSVYTFNTAGLELLEAAKAAGLRTIMEQTIAPAAVEKRLMEIEAEKHPEWPEAGGNDAYREKIAREVAEWELADVIVCGSQFVVDGVAEAGGDVTRCVVVPYGVDVSAFPPIERPPHCGPLRVLTVGSVGLRKGTPYVIEAAARLQGAAEFRVVGPGDVPRQVRSRLPGNIAFLGQVPRSEVRKHFQWADVFLLPSVCEGSAVATYEALLSGLPVICTPNSGSVVRDGVDGYIVSAGDPSAIVERLDELIRERGRLMEMGTQTREAVETCSREVYRGRLIAVIRDRRAEQCATIAAAPCG